VCAARNGCRLSSGDARIVVCRHTQYHDLALEPRHTYYLQESCFANLLLASVNRVQAINTECSPMALQQLRAAARRLAYKIRYVGYQPVEEWTRNYSGLKKLRYERAAASLRTCPLRPRDNYVTAFVKSEKVQDGSKDPRMIQFRSARYSTAIAGYLKGIEHSVYNLRGDGKFLPRGRLIAKGCTPLQRGYWVQRYWTELVEPVQMALDCSRFDAHVNADTLSVEHLVYTLAIKDPWFANIIHWQTQNRVIAVDKTGQILRYRADGKRMSGDMNTALGNCVLMILFLQVAFKRMRIPCADYRVFDDGDDCALFVEAKHVPVVQVELPKIFLEFGQELRIESIVSDFHRVTLCGCRPIITDQGCLMLMDPRRLLGKLSCCRAGGARPEYYHQVGECTLMTYPGIPVVSDAAAYLMRSGRRSRAPVSAAMQYKVDLAMTVKREVQQYTGNLAVELALAWDISVESQRYYHAIYKQRPVLQRRTAFATYDVVRVGVKIPNRDCDESEEEDKKDHGGPAGGSGGAQPAPRHPRPNGRKYNKCRWIGRRYALCKWYVANTSKRVLDHSITPGNCGGGNKAVQSRPVRHDVARCAGQGLRRLSCAFVHRILGRLVAHHYHRHSHRRP